MSDLAYVLLIIKGSKMPEREFEEPKDENAIGIMKSIVLKKENDKVKFFIRKGG